MNLFCSKISTMEVDSALVDHPNVAEAAVIGKQHEINGQAVCAFVSLKAGIQISSGLVDELKGHVAKQIGLTVPPNVLARADKVIK